MSGTRNKPGAATIALAAAGLIAAVAVGTALFRSGGGEGKEGANAAAPAAAQPPQTVEAAVAALGERVRRNPDDDAGWFDLGFALRGSGDIAGAERAFRRAAELRPGNADYVGYLGEALVVGSRGNPPRGGARGGAGGPGARPGGAQ